MNTCCSRCSSVRKWLGAGPSLISAIFCLIWSRIVWRFSTPDKSVALSIFIVEAAWSISPVSLSALCILFFYRPTNLLPPHGSDIVAKYYVGILVAISTFKFTQIDRFFGDTDLHSFGHACQKRAYKFEIWNLKFVDRTDKEI